MAVLAIVVLLSHRPGAIAAILLGLAGSRVLGPSVAASLLRHGGNILAFSALLSWVVLHAVYAPGRITLHRLQGAFVVYLNFAVIFASAFSPIWDLSPAGFANLPAPERGEGDLAPMLYFSLTTLTTIGYGDIMPIDPFARSLANLVAAVIWRSGRSIEGGGAWRRPKHRCNPGDDGERYQQRV